MRPVILDVTRLAGRHLEGRLPTGVDRIGLEYVRHFRSRATALVRHHGRWLEFSEPDSDRFFDLLSEQPGRAKFLIRWLVTRAYWRFSPAAARRGRFMLHTAHGGLEDLKYGAAVEYFGARPVFFLHDLIPITHPEYGRAGEKARHEARMKVMLQQGQGIIANSQSTADAMRAYARQKGLDVPPILAAPIAPAPLPKPDRAALLTAPYFVMLGTIEPRKNHLMILQAWRRLVERYGEAAPRLVLIGQRGWECENIVDLLERCEPLRGFVIEKPKCSDQELANYLAHARGLLFPSFAEGYGMPLAEALAGGLPVIASDLPAFREIAKDIPDYLDPLDAPGWMARIMDFAQAHSPARAAQKIRMAGFRPPSWSEHFDLVEDFLTRIGPR